jgi:exodeoxyribonuclease VII large subunit
MSAGDQDKHIRTQCNNGYRAGWGSRYRCTLLLADWLSPAFALSNDLHWHYHLRMDSVLTVTELTRIVRELLEGHVGMVWVEGEISNYRKQSSGHHYFTLKDNGSQLSCVMFARSYGAQSRVRLADGLLVQAFGQVTVYEARGQYQLVVQLIQPKGQGVLQAKFEALKKKLESEGLFDSSRKRKLPRFPKRIALVTSPTGAALQDMLNILQRRSPWLRILICPVRVQGEGASREIAAEINEVSRRAEELAIDLMVVGRGGGSLEDLWEFNEEIVARAIYQSRIPVVSAVGHEIDFTIADFVSDLRAPTPSAAAELVAPDAMALTGEVVAFRGKMQRFLAQVVELRKLRIQRAISYFREPERILINRRQIVDSAEQRLLQIRKNLFEQYHVRLRHAFLVLSSFRPEQRIQSCRKELISIEDRMCKAIAARLDREGNRVAELTKAIRLLGPQQTLERGYSITQDQHGNVIRNRMQVQVGSTIRTRLADGSIKSKVTDVDESIA